MRFPPLFVLRPMVAVVLGSVLSPFCAAQSPAEKPALILQKWSGALNVPDPVAVGVDPQGRVYVAATTRRKVADLDIREHRMWIARDVGLTSVADKTAFFREELAPGKLRAPRGGLKDHNGDGSIDWKDLTSFSERIYQLRDTDGDGTADKMTVFAEGFNTEATGIAAGVMYHDGWVYATIAPDLWRFKDTDDDGVADIREVVAHGFGVHLAYAGHDMHGLSVGPDGRIYWSIGDKGSNVTSKEGKNFYYPNEGAIFRVEPDGSNFEVYARGVRNPQEPAFDDFGDLIVVDNDADIKAERERFAYIVEGSDTGWRCNYQYMAEASPWMREGLWKPLFPGQAAYLLPAISNYSDGPAGFRYDPGTALGAAQRGMFFLNEFPSGKLRGFRAERDGATFKMVDASIVHEGVMGIGLAWHPDGSLFLADWIGGYPLDGLGAIWRVDAPAGAADPVRLETHRLLRAGFAATTDDALVPLLGHRDQRVRQGAQLELAKRGRGELLLVVARDASAPRLARVHAVWGVGQLLRRKAATLAAVVPLLSDADGEIRAQAVKILGDVASAKSEAKRLIPLLTDPEPRVRLQSAIALGKLGEPSAVEALFAFAAKESDVPVLRHAAVMGLVGCATTEQLVAKRSDPSVNVRLVSVVALRRLAAPQLAEFLEDADGRVVEEAARAIHDDLGVPAALPALAAMVAKRSPSEILTRRAINANLRLGTPGGAALLTAFALDEAASLEMRREALETLKVWLAPAPLDRVDGYARTFKPQPIAAGLEPKLGALLALKDPTLKTLGIEIMIAHALKAAPELIAAIVGETSATGDLRAQALRLMAGGAEGNPAAQSALALALAADSPAPLHRAALALLLPGQPERLVRETKVVFERRSLAEQQHALALLAKGAHPTTDAALISWADALVAGTAPDGLKLDVLEAAQARSAANAALAAKVKTYLATPEAAKQGALLFGGDSLAGRDLVQNHLNANCLACHGVEAKSGSEVGPNLSAIGAERDVAYLLESMLTPGASIAQGYGLVSVTLKDGSTVGGTLARETPSTVAVRQFDGATKTISRSEIASQTPAISIMPPMLGILQPREIRDVVAYLASLKPKPRGNSAAKAAGGE
jgi:putative membrane-bound dehydrogenase-like protein